MLFLTAWSLGICAGLLRSAFALALIVVLILLAFLAGGAISGGLWPFAKLGLALLGYNVGLINLIGGFLVARRMRAVRA